MTCVDPVVMKDLKNFFMKMPDNIQRSVFYSPRLKYKVISKSAVNKSLKETHIDLGFENKVTAHEWLHTHVNTLTYK